MPARTVPKMYRSMSACALVPGEPGSAIMSLSAVKRCRIGCPFRQSDTPASREKGIGGLSPIGDRDHDEQL